MKNLTISNINTVDGPGRLFNHTGILTYKGDYAGEFQNEALEALKGEFDDFDQDTIWGDIMINEQTGKQYAVVADSELTSYSGNLIYAELI